MISKHLDKNNLHHAYLIEGGREEIVPEILKFMKELGVETSGNSDFSHIQLVSFKIEDARNLKSYETEKGFSTENNAKKIFLISTNNFLLEAQHSLLKMFEEPIENTHFFVIVPDVSSLLKTFVSRFYLISARTVLAEGKEAKDAEKFIAMPLPGRIDFIKELLAEPEEEDEEGNVPTKGRGSTTAEAVGKIDSTRAKALRFLNSLEFSLHKKVISRTTLDINYFHQIFKVREFLRQPGSSTKTLMESVALTIPVL